MEKHKLNNLDKDGAIALAPPLINFTPTRSVPVAFDTGICSIIFQSHLLISQEYHIAIVIW